MKKVKIIMMALALSVPAVALAEEEAGSPPEEETTQELTDKFIDQRKQQLDELLARRLDEMEKEFAQAQEFRTRQKDERVSFEKTMIGEKKTFLDSLKAMKLKKRGDVLREFNKERAQKRREFAEKQRVGGREFSRTRKTGRFELRKGLKEEKKEIILQHREKRKTRKEIRKHKREEIKELKKEHREKREGRGKGKKD